MELKNNFLYIDSSNNFYIKSMHYNWCVGIKRDDEFIPDIKHISDMKSAVSAVDFITVSIDALKPGDLIFSCRPEDDLTEQLLDIPFRYSIVFETRDNGVDVIKVDMSDIKTYWNINPTKFYKVIIC